MNSLIKNLGVSILLSVTSFVLFAQQSGKRIPTKIVQYSKSSAYARGILLDGQRLFLSNSDGSVYCHDLSTGQNTMIFKMDNIDEMRDVEKSGDFIIAMHSGENGKIVRIGLDGNNQLIEPTEWNGVFLDGMDFIEEQGFLMGDPINKKFSLFHTNDNGASWTTCETPVYALEGEAGFAASGTNVQILDKHTYMFVSGGTVSRFFKTSDNGKSWSSVILPYYPGTSSGPYSMFFVDEMNGVIVGGDYAASTLYMNTCFYTNDGGDNWYNSEKPVRGYRSCVYATNGVYYACGTNGIDYSTNNGVDWKPFAEGSYFTMTANETHLIATTKNGTIHFYDLINKK